ncbi:hypothetical protein [Rhodococcus sp. YH1]|uniref:hypothetical protein n=1 Tax=Rhodococcus sp. YH1 TaxID=89066 RepID=UPI001A0CCC97|nr:hypothetical protein [Rhodococcus sp. YH1]
MTAKTYRKKPVEIQAMRVQKPISKVAEWCGGTVLRGGMQATKFIGVIIPTLEGNMRADIGDYVIRGVQGEFYPCKPDIFAQTYDEVPQ